MIRDAVVRVSADLNWNEPVSAVSRGLVLVTINGPAEAFDFLSNEWPARQGLIFEDARKAAMDALQGASRPADARSAFITACEDAGCLVRQIASR
ncbi:DUF982 domain-containing protein [Neorhizobium lilium]|uniref:DUF982 domain-containing protein n=1 Tax=Neorhizobium lilium TaxID=2503024 RepID=UPI0013E31D43|nr:DUF982 domain-containing protein [Neorhizobium lilium]